MESILLHSKPPQNTLAENNHAIILTEPIGSNLGVTQRGELGSVPGCLMPQGEGMKTRGDMNARGWDHLMVSSLILLNTGYQLELPLGCWPACDLSVVFPPGQVWAFSQHSGWSQEPRGRASQKSNTWHFCEVT